MGISEPVSSHAVLFPAASQDPLRNDLLRDPQARFCISCSGGSGSPSPGPQQGRGPPSSDAPSPIPSCLQTFLSPAQCFGGTPLSAASGPWARCVSPIPAGAAAAHVLSVGPGCDLGFPALPRAQHGAHLAPVDEANVSVTPGATQSPCSLSPGWEGGATGGSPSLPAWAVQDPSVDT